jgi:Zn-dependent protease with chaperone function
MKTRSQVNVSKWHSEDPLFILITLISLVLWLFLFISVIGVIYAVILGLFFFFSHLIFISRIKGSAVKLSENQFPDLHQRVIDLSEKIGLKKMPEVYVMQSGGSLNAFATKFFGSNIIVLYTDLLDACGDNAAARDMIIGHELGHLKAGHLRFMWLLTPGLLVPFIGSALMRAREFTCDRFGMVLSGDVEGALLGLSILAAGAQKGPHVNHQELVKQRKDFQKGFLTIGKWLVTHPPLCDRIYELSPALSSQKISIAAGALKAIVLIGLLFIGPLFGIFFFVQNVGPAIENYMHSIKSEQAQELEKIEININLPSDKDTVQVHLEKLADLVREVKMETGQLPDDADTSLSTVWSQYRPNSAEPTDPYDGKSYGYEISGENFILWSAGPDHKSGTDDDIVYRSK